MKLLLIALLFLFYNHINAQQPATLNKTLIEGNLVNIATNFLQIETKLNKRMSTYGLQLMYCALNLKASKLPAEFTDLLENFMSSVKTVQHLQNHQVLDISNINMSLFDYAQTRLMTLENDIRNYESIQEQLQTIGISIQAYMRNVSRHYVKNFHTLVKIRSKNRLMLATIRESHRISTELGDKIRLLKFRINYLIKLSLYFTGLINNQIIVPSSASINTTLDPFITRLKETEEKLRQYQEALRNAANIILAKIAIAEKSVQNSVSSVMNTSEIMKSLKIKAKGISEVNDLPKTTWPRFPDIPDNQQMIKLRSNFVDGKERKYNNIKQKARQNQTIMRNYKAALNVTSLSSSKGIKKVQAVSQTTIDVINAINAVEVSCEDLVVLHEKAVNEIIEIRDIFVPKTTTLATTQRYPKTIGTSTTPKVTTTSTLAPCGTFEAIDAATDPTFNALSARGFSAGITFNGRQAYVGYSPTNVSGLLTDDPVMRGVYWTNKNATSGFFLLNHPDLRYVKTNSTQFNSVPNKVNNGVSYFPRFQIYGSLYIGRAYLYDGTMTAWPVLSYGFEDSLYYTYEMLVCDSTIPLTTEPTTTPPCGTFQPIDAVSNPTFSALSARGFSAGITFNGRQAYVGYNLGGIPSLFTDDPERPALYFSNQNATFGFFLLNHPNLQYVATNTTKVDSVLNKVVSSKNVSFSRSIINGTVYIGRVGPNANGNITGWPITGFNIGTSARNSYDVLVCV